MPADLLVEQGRAGGAVDPGVGADPELAEEARAGIGRERGLEIVVAPLGAGLDDLARRENVSSTSSTCRRRAGWTGP